MHGENQNNYSTLLYRMEAARCVTSNVYLVLAKDLFVPVSIMIIAFLVHKLEKVKIYVENVVQEETTNQNGQTF